MKLVYYLKATINQKPATCSIRRKVLSRIWCQIIYIFSDLYILIGCTATLLRSAWHTPITSSFFTFISTSSSTVFSLEKVLCFSCPFHLTSQIYVIQTRRYWSIIEERWDCSQSILSRGSTMIEIPDDSFLLLRTPRTRKSRWIMIHILDLLIHELLSLVIISEVLRITHRIAKQLFNPF